MTMTDDPGHDLPTLRVGTTGDYKPVTWYDSDRGRFEGRDIDLIEAFSSDRGYRIVFVKTTWPTLMRGLLGNDYELAVGGITGSNARSKDALFSVPISAIGKVALVRSGEQARFATMALIDRPGVKVIENLGGSNEWFAETQIKSAELVIVPDNEQPFDYLTDGRADVMFTDSLEALYIEEQGHGLCAVHPEEPYTHGQTVFLFRKDRATLRDEFNAWLSEKRKS